MSEFEGELNSTHYSVAKFIHMLFRDQYKCHIYGKSPEWFQKNPDNTWRDINKIVIQNRLSSAEVAMALADYRYNFMRNAEHAKLTNIISEDANIKYLNERLQELNEDKQHATELNNVDEARCIITEIKTVEEAIDLIQKKKELAYSDARDKKFAEVLSIETKLKNNTFKNAVMKVLTELFYITD
jgi:hypothetical protein